MLSLFDECYCFIPGIVKDIMLVVLSVLVFGSPVTPLQYAGYGVALLGLNLHKEYKVSDEPTYFVINRVACLTR